MKEKKKLVFLGMLLTAMLAGVTAEAQSTNYTGSNCVVYRGTGAAYNYSAIGNSSSGTLYLDCPVDNQTPTTIESGWVKVQDQNNDSGSEVCCTLASIYFSGSSIYGWLSNKVCSSGYGTTWQTLSFGSLSNSSTGHIYYSCTIPKNDVGVSWIGTYQVSE
jgi:hypothetical protein